jgi:class 3 adenylate cyclase
MDSPRWQRQTWAMALFWGLMVVCGVLTAACTYLALGELGQPWGGFALHSYGTVGKGNDTGLVYFDKILAVHGSPVQSGADIRAIIRRTPPGRSLTYDIRRGPHTLQIAAPVQVMTWQQLLVEFGIPLLVALGQLCMGAVVFLLRPNTPRSWVFLGFCLAWFGLFVTFYDFSSTHIFTHVFSLCWFLTSAFFLHLAFVFPEERPLVRHQPQLQYLLYLPSLLLWGADEFVLHFLHPSLVKPIVDIHTVYWGGTLLFLLATLAHTALRAPSPVARRRAHTVLFGFAAGFVIPVGCQIATMLWRLNLSLDFARLLVLLLPLSITYAILRYNLLDVGVIVRRTLTYGVLTGTVIAAYVLLIWASDTLLRGFPLVQSRGFPVFFGLAVLFVLNPLRERLQASLDRFFFRTRYDFRHTIEVLSQELTALLNLEEIAKRMVNTVMGALQVSSVALYLEDGQGGYTPLEVAGEAADHLAGIRPLRSNPVVELIAQQRRGISRYDLEANPALLQQAPEALGAFARLGVSLALPMLFKDELIGLLALGDKKSGAVFTATDLELLRTLTNQCAIAMANARAYRSLEEANAELRAALRRVELLEHVKLHLGKFVPAAVRQIIERDPTAPALDKHERDVTVLFLDIAGYTSLSETLDQGQVGYLVERYFSSFLDDIYDNGGDINETAGDGLMIIFQADDPRQHACAAVRAALAIREKTRRINAELESAYAPLTVNMGLNSGSAAVGSTKFESATGTRWTFTASGAITNLAARLSTSATGGAIYVGPETAQRLTEEFALQALGSHVFKNVQEPVVVYEVLEQRLLVESR